MSLGECLSLLGLEALLLLIASLLSHYFQAKLHGNWILAFGLSLTLPLAVLQLVSGWIVTFGIPLSWFVSLLIFLGVVIIPLFVFLRTLNRDIFQNRKEYISTLIPVVIASQIFMYLNSRYGDLGWDSNAYHLPVTYELQINSAKDWDQSLGLGYYTFFAPYGVHSLHALSMSITGSAVAISATNSLFAIAISMLAGGIAYSLKRNELIAGVVTVSTFLIPSIAGQIGHNYIDLATGTYWLAAASVLMSLIGAKWKEISSRQKFSLTLIFAVFVACSISAKTHQIVQTIPLIILFSFYSLRIFGYKMGFKLISASYIVMLSGLFPYLRNWFEYSNPIFPIANKFFESGNINLDEFNPMFANFRPHLMTSGFEPLNTLVIWPILSMVKVLLVNIGLTYDENRPDLALFTYDSTISGAGPIFSIFNLVGFVFGIIFVFRTFILKQLKQSMNIVLNSTSFILLGSFVSISITPGSYWPRYILGPAVLISTITLVYVTKYVSTRIMLLITAILVILSIYGYSQTYNYETNRFARNSEQIYGLNGILPREFLEACDSVIVVEPRPVFTSAIAYAKCKEISHISVNEISELNISADSTWIVASKEALSCKEYIECPTKLESFANKKIKVIDLFSQRGWFDTVGSYETLIMKVQLR